MISKAHEKLAIDGGMPVRKTYLQYGRQYIDQKDIDAVVEVLQSDYLTCGPKIVEMEHRLEDITSAKHALAVSNGTAALHLACLSAGLRHGDEVIVSPMTFAASANCVLYCGATPVFADIDDQTWNIAPEKVEQCVTERTKAIIVVDYMGQAASLHALEAICNKYHLLLMEDASHALGTKFDGRPVGSIADMTTFSFHPVKTVTSGEGGALTTNNSELFEKARIYRTHGITRDPAKLIRADNGNWYYEQQLLGFNYRITDIQAALCMSQLDKLELFSRRRKEITALYNQEFSSMDEIVLPVEIPESDTVRHLYVIRLNLDRITTDRKTVFKALQAENIGVNVHYIPVYRLPYYEQLGYPKGLCPNAEAHYESCITLPLYYSMTDDDAADVVCAIKKVIQHYSR